MKKFIVLILLSFILSACSTTEYQHIDNQATTIEDSIGEIEGDLDKLNREAGIIENQDDDTLRKNSASKLYNKYMYK